jgi:thiol-disulfide isomerase/thioredoxin
MFMTVVLSFVTTLATANPVYIPKNIKLKGIEKGTLNTTSLQQYDMTVISFFASWCGKCGKTMHDLNRMTTKVDGVNWVALSVDEEMESAREFFHHLPKKYGKLKNKAYLDKNVKVAESLDVESLPAYVIVDKKGKVIYSGSGHPTDTQLKLMQSILTRKQGLAH